METTAARPDPNPYAPPRAVVRDIAPARAGVELAEPLARLGAHIIDTLIFAAMAYIPFLLFVAVGAMIGSDDGAKLMIVVGGVAFLVGIGVFLVMTVRQLQATGQSLGKKYCNIKVVRADGSPVTLSRVVWLRNVVNWLISLVPLYSVIDVLFIFGQTRQCLHDKLADTIVVKA